jgi:hypothetical protein
LNVAAKGEGKLILASTGFPELVFVAASDRSRQAHPGTYLASPRASGITGAALKVDGGVVKSAF